MIGLTPRLKMIYDCAEYSAVTLDVGCDHAKLPIALLNGGKSIRAIASDVNIGPLMRAKTNISKQGLDDKIDAVLSDGAANFADRGIDQIIIAGMGGELIRDIIIAAEWIKCERPLLLLQPMTAHDDLKRFLYENGYKIIGEHTVCEGSKPYELIISRYDGIERSYDELWIEFGEHHLANRDSATVLLAKKRVKALEKRLLGAKGDYEKEVIMRVMAKINKYLEE